MQTSDFTNATWDNSKGVKIQVSQSETATIGCVSYAPEFYTGAGAVAFDVSDLEVGGSTSTTINLPTGLPLRLGRRNGIGEGRYRRRPLACPSRWH